MMYEIREGVIHGIETETVHSEAGVCGIVTHEVAMHLVALQTDRERLAAIGEVTREAILGVFQSQVPFHSFAVAEATRGVIHGLVCAGLDISYVTRPATRAIRQTLSTLGLLHLDEEKAIRTGCKQALDDLGMNRLEDDQALDLPDYFTRQTSVFGETF